MPGRVVRHVFRMASPLGHEAPWAVVPTWGPGEGSSAVPFVSGFQQAVALDPAIVDRGAVASEAFDLGGGAGAVAAGADLTARLVEAGDFDYIPIALGWY